MPGALVCGEMKGKRLPLADAKAAGNPELLCSLTSELRAGRGAHC